MIGVVGTGRVGVLGVDGVAVTGARVAAGAVVVAIESPAAVELAMEADSAVGVGGVL